MISKRIAVLAPMLVLGAGVIAASGQRKAVFTSVYTSLDKGCKTIGLRDAEATGTDPAFRCPGVGGLEIYISNAAMAADLIVQTRRSEKSITGFRSECANYGRRAEWRLGNGKPFAVIIRVVKYPDDNISSEQPCSKKIGSTLLIKGLAGYEDLDAAIDGSLKAANEQVRVLADDAFRSKQKSNQ